MNSWAVNFFYIYGSPLRSVAHRELPPRDIRPIGRHVLLPQPVIRREHPLLEEKTRNGILRTIGPAPDSIN